MKKVIIEVMRTITGTKVKIFKDGIKFSQSSLEKVLENSAFHLKRVQSYGLSYNSQKVFPEEFLSADNEVSVIFDIPTLTDEVQNWVVGLKQVIIDYYRETVKPIKVRAVIEMED